MIKTHKDITDTLTESADVCVVGSGAGGAVVAKELAEAGFSVILLEEGGYFQPKDFRSTDTVKSVVNLYRDAGANVIFGTPNILLGEGRCVGGSTTINGGMAWRTPDKILKRWQWEKGLMELTPKRMEPFFQRVEKNLSVGPVIPEATNKDALLLKKGAERLNYEVKANLRSADHCVGANQCITGCPTGAKQPTLVNYIPQFLKAGGQLITNCRVKKVRVSSDKASGIVGEIIDPITKKKKAKIKIHSKITIVCGGAIQSPALLQRSGIKDEGGLLGKNLLIHPNTKVMGVFEDEVTAWKGVNQAYQVTEFMDEGIIMGVNFIPPGLMGVALPFHERGLLDMMKEVYNNSVVGAALIEDTSRGEVKSYPFDQTVATYQLNDFDFKQSLRATALLAEIYFAAGARKVFLPFTQFPVIHTIDEVRKIYDYPIKKTDIELMTVHIMGTCQMGEDPNRSVINSHGEFHNIKGLFVADASVFPSSIGVNPQITIMALATRTASYIVENRASYMNL